MGKYPDCFPENFETEILPKGAQENSRRVYRIIKYDDEINRKNFMSTYEEIQSKLMPRPKRYNENDPSIYSTSCQLDLPALRSLLACCMKHHPKAFIAVGTTEGSCGLSQLTAERNPEKKDGHVDWWVYADAKPHRYFKKVE